MITRSWELQEVFKRLGKGSSYGKATTHHEKLWPKIEGGGGGGCPVLTFAIKPVNLIDDGEEAFRKLLDQVAEQKARKAEARKAARKAGIDLPDEEDDEE